MAGSRVAFRTPDHEVLALAAVSCILTLWRNIAVLRNSDLNFVGGKRLQSLWEIGTEFSDELERAFRLATFWFQQTRTLNGNVYAKRC